MLKHSYLPPYSNFLTNKTCGEIVCQSETSFIINCKFCNLKIFEFKEFLQHFRNTHWLDIKVVESGKKFDVGEDIFSDQKVNESEDTIKSEICVEEYSLNETAEECELSDQDEWRPDREVHLSDSSSSTTEGIQETKTILKKKLKCCTRKEQPFKCNLCYHSFTNKPDYESHVEKHKSQKFKCEKCNKSFTKASQLTQHQYSHNGYPCTICNKIFKRHDSLRFHGETHIQTKNFVCDYKDCLKAFVNKRRLNAHKRLHFLEATFVCEICGSRQRNKQALTDHIRTHTGEKPFACILCDRRFSTRSLLSEHKACHETERKHVCDVCGKSFNRQKALYHHKHLHLDVKKFVCKICGAAYAQAAGLSAHMRKHKENLVMTNDELFITHSE